jgi:hypothetical protein
LPRGTPARAGACATPGAAPVPDRDWTPRCVRRCYDGCCGGLHPNEYW